MNSDRGTGTTPPERGPEGTSVVGRPPKDERESLNEGEALDHGGSFDGIAPPGEKSPGG